MQDVKEMKKENQSGIELNCLKLKENIKNDNRNVKKRKIKANMNQERDERGVKNGRRPGKRKYRKVSSTSLQPLLLLF